MPYYWFCNLCKESGYETSQWMQAHNEFSYHLMNHHAITQYGARPEEFGAIRKTG